MKRIGVMVFAVALLTAWVGEGIGQTPGPAPACVASTGYCTQYTYDSLGRVIAAYNINTATGASSTNGTGQIYTYDAAGNRITSYTGTPVMFSITPTASVVKGQTLSNVVTVTKSLNTNTASVYYQTVNGTAIAGVPPNASNNGNYTKTSGTLIFGPNTTTQTISITTRNDGVYDGPLTFTIQLTPASANAAINYSSTTVTINEPSGTIPPAYSVSSPTSVGEGNPATLNVTRSTPAGQTETVNYTTSALGAATPTAGIATPGVDYLTTAGTLTFAPNVNSQPITVPTLARPNFEGTRGFNVTLSQPSGQATIGTAQATQLITDSVTNVAFSVSNETVAEGYPVSFPVTLTGGTLGVAFTLNYQTQDGTAIAGTGGSGDYTAANGTVIFPAGSPAGTVETIPSVQTNNSTIGNGSKTFTVNLTSAPPGATLNSGTGTITDSSVPGAVTGLGGYGTSNGEGPWYAHLSWNQVPGQGLEYVITPPGGGVQTFTQSYGAELEVPYGVGGAFTVVACYTNTQPLVCGASDSYDLYNPGNGD